MNRSFWANRRVFLTGHTGFKGGWLALWLQDMGASVFGFALEPPTTPNLFSVGGVDSFMMSSVIADIRDHEAVAAALIAAKPEIVFHLAAQPLVRLGYQQPLETFATNVLGTVSVLEAARTSAGVRAIVNVTTDKCYENREWHWSYRENDGLGGFDPYSSSKACAELVTSAYRNSFLHRAGVGVASVRAGNVIGGGDWAVDRLIPDFFRAMERQETLVIRSPEAVRPWQHVLEPISGYLTLAEKLFNDREGYAEAWNFGPAEDDSRSVGWIVERMASVYQDARWVRDTQPQPHEAQQLRLDSSKAKSRLGWKPRWTLEQALDRTLEWHGAWTRGCDMRAFSLNQIRAYEAI